MTVYAIRNFEDGLSGAKLLHRLPNGLLVFDYPSQIGNLSFNALLSFECEDKCIAWRMENIEVLAIGGAISDSYVVRVE